jgi:flagellar basal-body rod protein FlgG
VIYGLYLSATGVIANSYREDVIANNLANAETTAFKRNTTAFQQRLTAAQEKSALAGHTDPLQEGIGGGFLVSPTGLDLSQGDLEATGNTLDLAVVGKGFFAVDDHGKTELTRDGKFIMDRDGNVIVDNATGQHVLGADMKPLVLDPSRIAQTTINASGEITQNGKLSGQVGLFDVSDPTKLVNQGGSILDYSQAGDLKSADGSIRSQFTERASVDPAVELTHLMDAQRQLEANANMIKYQDETLGKAVTDVGKLS